jgi:hypothetical protein
MHDRQRNTEYVWQKDLRVRMTGSRKTEYA